MNVGARRRLIVAGYVAAQLTAIGQAAAQPARETSDRGSQAELLTRSARNAARLGDCSTVAFLGKRVRDLDADHYRRVFVSDPVIQGCGRPAVASDARLEPPASAQRVTATLEPPAPLRLPELAPRTRVGVSVVGATYVLLAYAITTEVSGSIAVGGGLELFGRLPATAAAVACVAGCGERDSAGSALGNLRLGARYAHAARAGSSTLSVAPAAWAWIPTWGSLPYYEDPREFASMTGLGDTRAFSDEAALGLALDVALRSGSSLVQVEGGAALVLDRGSLQVDNVFAALGLGRQVSEKTAWLAEWRVEAYPRGPRLHALAFGMSRRRDDRTMWRLRVHPVQFEGRPYGAAIGYDLIHHFE